MHLIRHSLKYSVYPEANGGNADETEFPQLRFDKLLDALFRIIPRFRFQLPPYFINNARALNTREGLAKMLDPTFNFLRVYPHALNRMLINPTDSSVVDRTLQTLICSPETGCFDPDRAAKLLDNAALLTGYKKKKLVRDLLQTSGGRRLALRIALEEVGQRVHLKRIRRHFTNPTRLCRL